MKVAGCGGAMPDGLTVIVDAKSRAGRLVLERCLSSKGAGRERELHRRPRDRCRSYWQIASTAPVPSITSLHVRPDAAQSSWTSHRCDVALQYSTTFPLQRLPFAGQRNGTAKFPMSGQPQAGSNVNTSNAHRPFLLFTTYYPSSRDGRTSQRPSWTPGGSRSDPWKSIELPLLGGAVGPLHRREPWLPHGAPRLSFRRPGGRRPALRAVR